MGFEFKEYLSEWEMKEIATQAFKDKCKDALDSDFERIIGNAAYAVVWKASDAAFNEGHKQALVEKVEKVIKELSPFAIFQAPSFGDKGNEGYRLLDNAVRDNQHLINERLEVIISEFEARDFKVDLNYEIQQLLMQRLFGEKWENEL